MKASCKLAALAEQELPLLLNQVIIEDGEKYRVFGKYTIHPVSAGFQVRERDEEIGSFSGTKAALAWCIADNLNHFNLARRIKDLDQSVVRLRNDIYVRGALADRTAGNTWENLINKTNTRQEYTQVLEKELAKCINLAKYWQLRGNSNETKRIGHNTPHTTNF
jgi:hypothetical protein